MKAQTTYTCSLAGLRGYQVYLKWGVYGNGRTALQLICVSDHSLFATATVNVPDIKMEPGETAIKDYAENKGMLKFLNDNGLVQPGTVRAVKNEWVSIPIVWWTEEAKTLIQEALCT